MLSRCGTRFRNIFSFHQCVLPIFLILNTHVKCRLKKICYRSKIVFKAIYIYIYTRIRSALLHIFFNLDLSFVFEIRKISKTH